jgi:hypothetical protein
MPSWLNHDHTRPWRCDHKARPAWTHDHDAVMVIAVMVVVVMIVMAVPMMRPLDHDARTAHLNLHTRPLVLYDNDWRSADRRWRGGHDHDRRSRSMPTRLARRDDHNLHRSRGRTRLDETPFEAR